jgi:predicted nucleotidyltransferase
METIGTVVGQFRDSSRREVTEETARLVDALREVLRDRQDVHLALLFGSQARGKARPDSDVDVAVLGENLDVFDLYGEARG